MKNATMKSKPRPLKADAGLYKHHCAMRPYTDPQGVIRECYQALDERNVAIATLSMTGGELDDHANISPPTPLHRVALESWAAQIGDDYHRREAEIEVERISYGEIAMPNSDRFESADDGFFETREEAEERVKTLRKYYP